MISRFLAVLVLASTVVAQTPDESMVVHNYPNAPSSQPKSYRIFDWKFIAVHVAAGGATAFDNWETQRHLVTCAFEGNDDLGRTPTAQAQAIHGLVEFSAVVAGDALIKWIGKRQGVPHWLNDLGSSSIAAISIGKHTAAGMRWVHLCG